MIDVDWRPERNKLKNFAVSGCVVFALLGGWLYFKQGPRWLALTPSTGEAAGWVLWAFAAYSLMMAFVAPKAVLPIYYILTCISVPVGFVLSHVILFVIFYGLFTPVALVFRIRGRDVLSRRFEPQARSYWIRREPTVDVRRYFRQF